MPHPDRLLESLTAAELAEWQAYAMIEPIGQPVSSYGESMHGGRPQTSDEIRAVFGNVAARRRRN